MKSWPLSRRFLSPVHFTAKYLKHMTGWQRLKLASVLLSWKLALLGLYRFLRLVRHTSPTPKSLDGVSTDWTARFARRLYHILPISVQFWMRDSGFMRIFMDFMNMFGALLMSFTMPKILYKFLRTDQHVTDIPYGTLYSHKLDVFCQHSGTIPTETEADDEFPLDVDVDVDVDVSGAAETKELTPVILFVHGGAWGSGFKAQYRLIGHRFDEEGFVTVVPGYRLYPEADAHDQMRDVHKVLLWTYKNIEKYGGDPNRIYLTGHSSGAQVCMLLLTTHMYRSVKQDQVNAVSEEPVLQTHEELTSRAAYAAVRGFISMSAPFDIAGHLDVEYRRKLHTVSPMLSANIPKIPFIWSNPQEKRDNRLMRQTSIQLMHGLEHSQSQLRLASPTHLTRRFRHEHLAYMPPLFAMHGTLDCTVPPSSTISFCQALVKAYKRKVSALSPLPRETSGVGDMKLAGSLSGFSSRDDGSISDSDEEEVDEDYPCQMEGLVECHIIKDVDHMGVMTDLMGITRDNGTAILPLIHKFVEATSVNQKKKEKTVY